MVITNAARFSNLVGSPELWSQGPVLAARQTLVARKLEEDAGETKENKGTRIEKKEVLFLLCLFRPFLNFDPLDELAKTQYICLILSSAMRDWDTPLVWVR